MARKPEARQLNLFDSEDLNPSDKPQSKSKGPDASTRPRVRPVTSYAAPDATLHEKAWVVHERLCKEYHCPIPYFHTLDPLSELVSSLLSHRTRNKESGLAYRTLRASLPTWQAVIDAPTLDIQRLIENVTWPEMKAPRIQSILGRVKELRGELSLEFLADRDVPAATAWLRSIPGVGPKTAAAVLSFSTLRKPALPVDSHHHRVAERLRLLPPGVSLDRSHEILAAQLPIGLNAQQVYDNHEVLMIHGQRVCTHHAPACNRCILADICPSRRTPQDIFNEPPIPSPGSSS
jgi:endonuclease III